MFSEKTNDGSFIKREWDNHQDTNHIIRPLLVDLYIVFQKIDCPHIYILGRYKHQKRAR